MENKKPTLIEWILSGVIIFIVSFLLMTTAAYADNKCSNESSSNLGYYQCSNFNKTI